ncbi:MAG TPA: hypothetical protein DCY13_03090, partial [Verrucomicrobiales bacterium]|nr:hypothetical protein [Verrucomicrobiales bacterium]
PIFGPLNFLMRLSDEKFAQTAPNNFKNLARSRQAKDLHPSVVQMLSTVQPKTKGELAVAYGNLIAGRDAAFNRTMEALVKESGLRVVRGRKQNEFRQLREQIAALELAHPGAPGRAMVLYDAVQPKDSPVFIRGEANNRGDIVPRRFLEVLGGSDSRPFANGSGRLDLARAIADPANPLTARVMVNRVWQHHFGDGLVRTASDFGTRGELPTHPELLEWLTGEFIQSGWSLKHLHRLIVNSATYQQSSALDKRKAAIDPENRLLWRRRPVRLESEILRDSMLAVAGTLNPAMFGPSFKPPIPAEALQARNVKDPYPKDAKDTPETRRRTIYMFHKRVGHPARR